MTFSISKGRIKKAIQECLKQIEKAPKDRRLRLELGALYLKNGEKEKAVSEYLKAGDLHAEEELNARAIAIYKKVVSIDPKHIKALHKMGKLYFREGLLGDAKNCYERILQISARTVLYSGCRCHTSQSLKAVPPGQRWPLSGRWTKDVAATA